MQTITAFRTLWKNGVRVELSCGHSIMLATEANLSAGQRWACPDCPAPSPGAPLAAPTVPAIPGPGGTFHWTPDTEALQFTPDPQTPAAREATNPTCARCHTVIVAEDGDTCANIPHWQRGAFPYCTEPEPPLSHQAREAAQRADEAELQAGLLATLPVMAGGAPMPADDPAGPGAPAEAPTVTHYHATVVTTHRTPAGAFLAHEHTEPIFRDRADAVRAIHHKGGKDCPYCVQECGRPGCLAAPHTHPCPTCHQARACACTTFPPGTPLECANCSNCRGW